MTNDDPQLSGVTLAPDGAAFWIRATEPAHIHVHTSENGTEVYLNGVKRAYYSVDGNLHDEHGAQVVVANCSVYPDAITPEQVKRQYEAGR